eukprot:1156345-Pelagomonas_calceolata.AAC.2
MKGFTWLQGKKVTVIGILPSAKQPRGPARGLQGGYKGGKRPQSRRLTAKNYTPFAGPPTHVPTTLLKRALATQKMASPLDLNPQYQHYKGYKGKKASVNI